MNNPRIAATLVNDFCRNYMPCGHGICEWGYTSLNKANLTRLTALALAAALPFGAFACEGLRDGPMGTVVEVTDGDTVVLDSGTKVRLIGMQAPKLPLGREGFETWPLADEARDALADIAMGQDVTLRFGGEDRDRHGRALAHMFIGDDEIWAQAAMLEAGLARVYSFPDNRFCLDELYAAEARARAERRGIWTDPYYQLRDADDPDSLLERVDQYELVEGRVLQAEQVGSRVYLNFGRFWKEDFTVVIERDGLRLFETEGADPLALEGKLIRVRGWIGERDGPRMDVTHPEQIEVLAVQ